jgi:hypothetical protein
MRQYTVYLTGIADGVIQSGVRVRVNAECATDARTLAISGLAPYGYHTIRVDDWYDDGPADGDAGIVSC